MQTATIRIAFRYCVIVSALLGALAAQGQDRAQDHPSGFDLTTPLSLSSGYDDGFVAGSRKLSDTVTILTAPTLQWSTSTRRTVFSVNYDPEFEIFTHNRDFDAVNHTATLTLRHRINSRWSLDVGDGFFSTMDATRTLSNSLLLFPRGRFDQNTLYADAVYRLDRRTTATFRLDSVYTTVAIPELHGGLDNITAASSVVVDRSLTSHQDVSGSYTFIYTKPLDQQPGRDTSGINMFVGGYTYTAQPNLVFRVTAGGIQGGHQSGFTGSAAIQRRIGGLWVGGGYQRYLGFFGGVTSVGELVPGQIAFASGVTPNVSYDTVSLRAIGQLTKRIGLNATAQRAINATDVQGLKIHSLIGQIRLDYRINERLVLFARAEHYGENVMFFLNQPISRNRYFAGLEIALSRTSSLKPPRRRDKPPQDSFAIIPSNLGLQ